MKRGLIVRTVVGIILAAAVFVPVSRADVHIRQKQVIEPYYEYGVTNPAREQSLETWIGKDRASVINARWAVLIDFEAKKLIYLGHRTRVYAETELPFDSSALYGPDALEVIKASLVQGTVKPLPETKTVMDRPCQGYEVMTWIDYEGDRAGDRKQVIWSTTSIPIDAAILDKILHLQYVLSYFSDDLIKAYETIKGFPLLRELTLCNRGIEIKARVETLEIAEQTPDAKVYAIPSGYSKKTKIDASDIR